MATAKTTAAPTDAAPKFKLPKSLAECADLLYTTRKTRLALAKEVEALAAKESALREELINKLPKSQASGIAGKVARASIENKTVYSAKDWDAIHGYILKQHKKNPGVWSLLQRRLGDATCKELFEAGVKVPGVEAMEVPTVSLNKL